MIKRCDNCRTGIQPDTTHQPATDEIGGGICVVTHHPPNETAWQSVPPRKPHLRLRYSPARGRTVEHWKVTGPNGHTLWGSGRTAAGAVLAYQLGHTFGRPR